MKAAIVTSPHIIFQAGTDEHSDSDRSSSCRSVQNSMADRATITLTVVLLALLSVTLHLVQVQAQVVAAAREEEAAAGGEAGAAAAEYVLLEPKPERLLEVAADALNGTESTTACRRCRCCLRNTNPQECLTTCCFRRSCGVSFCTVATVSCGCNGCAYPPPPPGKK
ncbi:hypothetical protein PAHAL_2G402400 [Panicum hallii]|uniref:Uncharacterized protein n=1 Tax=Panicum hallii TaxID=206008 RepID=A0A2T8KS44_9POAL|nr:hypothetical protein PAHAL_2G402400 [Panicum hallii]